VVTDLEALASVPGVEGLRKRQALTLLEESGLSGRVVARRLSPAPWHRVIVVEPAVGTTVLPGTSVHLTLSRPPPLVPDVELTTLRAAVNRLEARGYAVKKLFKIDLVWPSNTIIDQRGPNRAQPGEVIPLVIAKEPACTPGYSPCLPPASDYDCAGGSGDGPRFTGPVRVSGIDIYDLDDDSDGRGCE
jgi:beta-lactam-binding protein with PASTA domain